MAERRKLRSEFKVEGSETGRLPPKPELKPQPYRPQDIVPAPTDEEMEIPRLLRRFS
jgi:hypothetical protein